MKYQVTSSASLALVWWTICVMGFSFFFYNNPNPKEQVPDFPKPELKAVICWNGTSRGPLCQIPKEKVFASIYGQKNPTLRTLSTLASFVTWNIIHWVLSSVQATRSRRRLIVKCIRSEGIGQLLCQWNIHVLRWPGDAFLLNSNENICSRENYKRMFVALLIIANKWKQPKPPSISEWMYVQGGVAQKEQRTSYWWAQELEQTPEIMQKYAYCVSSSPWMF